MSAKKSDEAIPLKALEMAIVMVNAADQCDQAGQWDRDHRRACRHILDWYNSNDYKITCDKAGANGAKHGKWTKVPYISHCGCGKKMDIFRYLCSECERTSEFQAYGLRFCPYCGSDNGDALGTPLEVNEDAGSD